MDEAGAVEKHVDGTGLGDQRLDRGGVEDIQPMGADTRLASEAAKGVGVDIRRVNLGTGSGEGECGCAPYPLRRSCDEDDLSAKVRCHWMVPSDLRSTIRM